MQILHIGSTSELFTLKLKESFQLLLKDNIVSNVVCTGRSKSESEFFQQHSELDNKFAYKEITDNDYSGLIESIEVPTTILITIDYQGIIALLDQLSRLVIKHGKKELIHATLLDKPVATKHSEYLKLYNNYLKAYKKRLNLKLYDHYMHKKVIDVVDFRIGPITKNTKANRNEVTEIIICRNECKTSANKLGALHDMFQSHLFLLASYIANKLRIGNINLTTNGIKLKNRAESLQIPLVSNRGVPISIIYNRCSKENSLNIIVGVRGKPNIIISDIFKDDMPYYTMLKRYITDPARKTDMSFHLLKNSVAICQDLNRYSVNR